MEAHTLTYKYTMIEDANVQQPADTHFGLKRKLFTTNFYIRLCKIYELLNFKEKKKN